MCNDDPHKCFLRVIFQSFSNKIFHLFFPLEINMSAELPKNINVKEPRWDQETMSGRAKHFFTVTDPRNILLTNEQLDNAKKIIHDYRYEVHLCTVSYTAWANKKWIFSF